MEQEFKNFVYAGIDLAAAVSDKFEAKINELVKDGKISAEDGKKMVDEWVEKSKAKKDELEQKMHDFVNRFKKSDSTEELEALKKRVADLEAALAAQKAANTQS